MTFNPYDYQRYFNALPSSQRSVVTSATISMVNYLADIEADLRRASRREDEFRYTINGYMYDNPRDAWQRRAFEEGLADRPDCGHGSAWD